MSDNSKVLETVKDTIANQLNVDIDKIESETSIIEDLGADSLDAVEILMSLEEAFEIDIPDDDAANLKTVQDIVDYIEQHS